MKSFVLVACVVALMCAGAMTGYMLGIETFIQPDGRISAVTPWTGFSSIRWSIGRTKARVFPVPVCAVATTSWPASAGGIAWACTGVIWTKRCFVRLLCKREHRESSEKFIIQNIFGKKNQLAGYCGRFCGSASSQIPA